MKAIDRIYNKQEHVVYKKVGRKYVPANDPWAYDGLREGYWLIKVEPGCTSIRSCVFPAKAELAAAARDKEDQLLEIIREASVARPKSIALSPELKKDWDDLIAKHGDAFSTLEYPSFFDNANKIIKALIDC